MRMSSRVKALVYRSSYSESTVLSPDSGLIEPRSKTSYEVYMQHQCVHTVLGLPLGEHAPLQRQNSPNPGRHKSRQHRPIAYHR